MFSIQALEAFCSQIYAFPYHVYSSVLVRASSSQLAIAKKFLLFPISSTETSKNQFYIFRVHTMPLFLLSSPIWQFGRSPSV